MTRGTFLLQLVQLGVREPGPARHLTHLTHEYIWKKASTHSLWTDFVIQALK